MNALRSWFPASFWRYLHLLAILRRWRGVLLAVAGLALLVANSLLTLMSVQSVFTHEQQVLHTQTILTTIQQVQTTLDEAETGQRGYLLTHEASYLAPYETARSQVQAQVTTLRSLTAALPAQQQRLATLQPLIQQKLAELQQTIDLDHDHGVDAALQRVRSGEGERLMEQIRQVLGAMRQTEQGVLQQQNADAQASVRTLVGTFALATLVDVGLLGLVLFRWQRQAQRQAQLEALTRVGAAISAELEQPRLLTLIAQAARDLTGAAFAAFTLRSEGESGARFHLAGAAGLTAEQEAVLRRIPLGGEGVLAPVYQERRLVRVADVPRDPRTIGTPRDHPLVRSFLGAPLIDRQNSLLGGLLLGHSQPRRFRAEHEAMLAGLAAQATVALENAHLYEQVQRRAEELEAVLESMVNGVALYNANGELVRMNRAAQELEEVTGTALARLLVEDLPGVQLWTDNGAPLPPAARPTRQALAGETIRSQFLRVRWASGEERELHVTAAPLQATGAGEARVVTVLRDVTTQRQQERAARLYEEIEARRRLLQALLDALPSGVYLVEATESRLVLANQAAETTWGAHWPIGMSVRDFFQTTGVRLSQIDGRPLPSREWPCIRVFAQEEPVQSQQQVLRQPTGATLPLLVSAVKLPTLAEPEQHGDAGEPPGALAAVVMQDISALKEAERLKDEFVALVSHELKNPLTSIKGYAQLLRLQLERTHSEPLSEQEQVCLQVIEEEIDRLSGLASDVIDVARLQSGRLALQLDDVELVGLVRRVAQRQQMTTTTHSLRVQLDVETLWLRADRSRLEQVLLNLVGNAIKYSPAGGPVEIQLAELAEAQAVQVSIQDHGIGIPREQQARLFGRFVRATNASAKGIPGTGLGLFLCRELIERHGGQVWVESEEGQGTTITFVLPLDGPAEDPF